MVLLVLKRRLAGFDDLMMLVAFCQLFTVTPNETADGRDLVERPPASHSAVRKTVA